MLATLIDGTIGETETTVTAVQPQSKAKRCCHKYVFLEECLNII